MIRLAQPSDLDTIDQIAEQAILHMAASNIPQWDLSYPRRLHFAKDVEDGVLFVYEQEGRIAGVMALRPEQDPPYENIQGWTVPHGESLVIHRVVIDPKLERQGIFQHLMDFAIQTAKDKHYQSIKIDTHHDNYKMRRFLDKNGFVHIGYLAVIDREAYERTWEDEQ